MPPSTEPLPSRHNGLFVTTRWSVVLAARNKASPGSEAALESLCQTYWYPLYAMVRALGHSPHDAQDLTQAFFERLLSKDYLRVVTREKGRFRTFLRVALKRFLADERDRARAQKRGGGRKHLPFDTALAEQAFLEDNTAGRAPDRLFDRRWALTLLDEATGRVQREYLEAGKSAELEKLKPYVTADRGTIPYERIAAQLQTSPGAARVAVHRLRRRFREVFRETIAVTVSDPQEAEQEFRYILEVLSYE
jgi:RNA polymerase sigma-70 factor (ECF subfamily)